MQMPWVDLHYLQSLLMFQCQQTQFIYWNSPVTATMIKKWTVQYPTLARVKSFILKWWILPPTDKDLCPYFNKRSELSIESGCVLRGIWFMVPPQGRRKCWSCYMRHTRYGTNEAASSQLCVVARNWCSNWGKSEDLLFVSVQQKQSTSGTTISMGVARKTMNKNLYRLRWSFHEQNVLSYCGCTHQVAGSTCDTVKHISCYYSETSTDICNIRLTWDCSFWQWVSIHKSWVSRVYEAKWNHPCEDLTILPIL